jgi:hypothetical protein
MPSIRHRSQKDFGFKKLTFSQGGWSEPEKTSTFLHAAGGIRPFLIGKLELRPTANKRTNKCS